LDQDRQLLSVYKVRLVCIEGDEDTTNLVVEVTLGKDGQGDKGLQEAGHLRLLILEELEILTALIKQGGEHIIELFVCEGLPREIDLHVVLIAFKNTLQLLYTHGELLIAEFLHFLKNFTNFLFVGAWSGTLR